ncbi:MAG: sulfatase-like hydrolase/transferase, partial [Bacteroidota bacterium]
MTTRIFLWLGLALGCCWWLFGCSRTPVSQTPPNIIILLADDLGYGDLSCYGSQSIHTPNLDALARQGMRFARFYAGSAVCSPSRASLLTGKFPLRYNITRHFNDREMHLPAGIPTLAKHLQGAGYHTVHIGKWHLGGIRIQDFEARTFGEAANPGPHEHGFTHYLCNIEDPLVRADLIKNRQLYRQGGKTLVRNDQRIPEISQHWTEIKIDEAIRAIADAQAGQKPFFLNLWFDVPHTPYE